MSSRTEEFYSKNIIENFAKFTGKTCVDVCFFIKLQASRLQIFEKETLAQLFPYKF